MILAIPVTLARLDLVYEAVGLLLQLCLEFLGGDALELRACVLHGSAARNGHLRHVVDVGAGLQHAQEVLLKDELLVLARHAKLVAVRGRVLVELGPVGFIAEGEEQLVQRIRAMRVLAVEHIGARNVFVVVFCPRGHVPTPDVNTCMGSIVARRWAEASGRRQPLPPAASGQAAWRTPASTAMSWGVSAQCFHSRRSPLRSSTSAVQCSTQSPSLQYRTPSIFASLGRWMWPQMMPSKPRREASCAAARSNRSTYSLASPTRDLIQVASDHRGRPRSPRPRLM